MNPRGAKASELGIFLPDETATERLGAELANVFPEGGLVFLCGELGAGKTTLVRGLLRALGHAGSVKSPTYTLVEPYDLGERQVFHFDLYRLGDPEELEAIGIRDYIDGDALCLVEWPERGIGILPDADLTVHLEASDSGRHASLAAGSGTGEQALENLNIM